MASCHIPWRRIAAMANHSGISLESLEEVHCRATLKRTYLVFIQNFRFQLYLAAESYASYPVDSSSGTFPKPLTAALRSRRILETNGCLHIHICPTQRAQQPRCASDGRRECPKKPNDTSNFVHPLVQGKESPMLVPHRVDFHAD